MLHASMAMCASVGHMMMLFMVLRVTMSNALRWARLGWKAKMWFQSRPSKALRGSRATLQLQQRLVAKQEPCTSVWKVGAIVKNQSSFHFRAANKSQLQHCFLNRSVAPVKLVSRLILLTLVTQDGVLERSLIVLFLRGQEK